MNFMIYALLPLITKVAGILVFSLAIYLGIRFFAYKRAFPLPRQYDFLWIIDTLLVLFLVCALQPPFEGEVSPKLFTWMSFLTFLLSSYLLIFVVDQFLVEYFLVTVLKIYVSPPLRKVIVLFVFLVAVVIGIQKIFSINPWAVYAPTSLLSLGIGIALKDAFQTFFAGVALSRIIRIGDWVRSGDREGEVMDINWARTVLRNSDGVYHFVPNSELQQSSFQSLSYGGGLVRCQIEVGASYKAPPQKVKKILLRCAQNVEGVLSQQREPEALLLNYGDSAVVYGLNFWIREYSRRKFISNEVATRVWYAFQREGIEIPFPIRTLQVVRKSGEAAAPQSKTVLSNIDLFSVLPPEEKEFLLNRLEHRTYLKGEIVVREGDSGGSFYIVLKGRLEVLKKSPGGQSAIGELSDGRFFGEMSLLTGEPRTATVRALADSELLRLVKKDFQEILNRHPALTENLAEVVAARQAQLDERNSRDQAQAVPLQARARGLSSKIREFFNLKETVK